MSDGKWWKQAWQLVDGCTPVSPGCEHCWARGLQRRFPDKLGELGTVRFRDDRLDKPSHWRKPRVVAVWNDLWHEAVTDEQVDRAFAVMALCPRHQFVVLTKRPKRAALYFANKTKRESSINAAGWDMRPRSGCMMDIGAFLPLPNVWLGTSAENQETFDERAPHLAQLAAAGWNTVLSCEPLLGPIDLSRWLLTGDGHDMPHRRQPGLDWLIAGGETGAVARPAHPDWFRSLRDQCQAAGVPFWFKGWGARASRGRELDGREWSERPAGMEGGE